MKLKQLLLILKIRHYKRQLLKHLLLFKYYIFIFSRFLLVLSIVLGFISIVLLIFAAGFELCDYLYDLYYKLKFEYYEN